MAMRLTLTTERKADTARHAAMPWCFIVGRTGNEKPGRLGGS